MYDTIQLPSFSLYNSLIEDPRSLLKTKILAEVSRAEEHLRRNLERPWRIIKEQKNLALYFENSVRENCDFIKNNGKIFILIVSFDIYII